MSVIATSFELAKLGWDAWSWARKNIDTTAKHAIPRIERYVNGGPAGQLVRINGIRGQAPRVAVIGPWTSSSADDEGAEEFRQQLDAINEPHAIVEDWDGTPSSEIKVRATDFAAVRAARSTAKPAVLSANALLVCAKRKCVVLHKRSHHSATYKGKLHVFGGAYKPPVTRGDLDSPGDRMSLEFTMVREVFEECGLIVRKRSEPVAVAQELDTGFVQFVFLGVRITAAECDGLSANSEGNVVLLPFDELQHRLADSGGWVPSGRAHVLAWLGLGAPGAGRLTRFGGKTAKQLFEDVVGAH